MANVFFQIESEAQTGLYELYLHKCDPALTISSLKVEHKLLCEKTLFCDQLDLICLLSVARYFKLIMQ